jgi:signal transduction histidine kinase
VGNEDTRATKGTGLGLYLIEKIIRKHKGDIQVLDNKPAGSIFEVTLNAAPADIHLYYN